MRFEPAVKPRALAILPGDKKVYVAGQTANKRVRASTRPRTVNAATIAVGAEPVAVVASTDGSADLRRQPRGGHGDQDRSRTDKIVGTLTSPTHPWGASLSADGKSLFVTHLLLHAGVTRHRHRDVQGAQQRRARRSAGRAANGKLVPNGVAARRLRGGAAARRAAMLWMPHMLLATETRRSPTLDFESTAFPTISTLSATRTPRAKRLLFKPLMVPAATGAFNDVISGPRALAFTPDGKLALLANSAAKTSWSSTATTGNERAPGAPACRRHVLEGIVVDHAGTHAYVDGRNTHNVVVLTITAANTSTPSPSTARPSSASRAPTPCRRRCATGQRLFYTRQLGRVSHHARTSGSPARPAISRAAPTPSPGSSRRVRATRRRTRAAPSTPASSCGRRCATDVVDYDTTIHLEQGGRSIAPTRRAADASTRSPRS